MNAHISVKYHNDVFIKIEVESSVAMELRDYFSFKVPNAQFIPAVRNRIWDGYIRLFNHHSGLLYAGLLPYIQEFAESRNYTLSADSKCNSTNSIPIDEVTAFLDRLKPSSNGIRLDPMGHQVEGIHTALSRKRTLLLSPTGSGKSLIIYALARWYTENSTKKTLIVVPTITLVHQMVGDFTDYANNGDNSWNCDANCHTIYQGQNKHTKKQIVIGTWQSLYKLPKDYFEQFDSVIIDESHQLASNSLKGILEKLGDCPNRVGLTGTLDGMKTNRMIIEGLTGKVHRVASTKDLMDKKILSELKIDCLILKYSDDERKLVKNYKYTEEIAYLLFHKKRNEFLTNLALSTKGNTMLLFQYVDKHGKVLHKILEEKLKGTNRKLFYVSGETEGEVRNEMRAIVEKENDAIIVGSKGCLSVGVNIKNLTNIIFASPSKARINILQSIGRQLRKSELKGCAKLYDVCDDLSWKSRQNYSLKHTFERIKIYNQEKFNFRTINVRI